MQPLSMRLAHILSQGRTSFSSTVTPIPAISCYELGHAKLERKLGFSLPPSSEIASDEDGEDVFAETESPDLRDGEVSTIYLLLLAPS